MEILIADLCLASSFQQQMVVLMSSVNTGAQLAAFVFKCQDKIVYQIFLAIVSHYLLVEAEE